MTIEEFNKIPFTGGMTAVCKGKEYPIVSCDLEDKMIAIQVGTLLVWISYKNIQ
jgi:hypothetical protein